MPFISQTGQRGDGTDSVVIKGKRWIDNRQKEGVFIDYISIFFKLAQESFLQTLKFSLLSI